MGPYDAPKEPPKSTEVRPADSSQDMNKFLDEWIKPGQSNSAGGKMTDTISLGQIQDMKIPSGWKEGETYKPTGGNSLVREFHPQDNAEVKLSFYYRGRRVSDNAGKTFHDLLQEPPHTLKPQELEALREIVREKTNPESFNLLQAKTEDIGGKRVLVVEGRYKETETDSRAVYVDSDGSGTAVQEILYQAPRSDYSRYLPIANSAIKSIKWKSASLF